MTKSKTRELGPTGRKALISAGVATVVILLIYFEQIAILYVLATFALIALLVAVAFSDLESVGERERKEALEAEQAASAVTTSHIAVRRPGKHYKAAEVLNVDN